MVGYHITDHASHILCVRKEVPPSLGVSTLFVGTMRYYVSNHIFFLIHPAPPLLAN